MSYFDQHQQKVLLNLFKFICSEMAQRGVKDKINTVYKCFKVFIFIYSRISVIRTSIIRNYWVIRRPRTVPTFFSIIYCNKTTYYSNFDYPKKSIFRSDSSVPIKEIAIKLPFKIRSPNDAHGDHDFFVWSSSIYTPE